MWLSTMVVMSDPLESSSVTTQQREVNHHAFIQMTAQEASAILKDATTALQTKDGPGDMACDVVMALKGMIVPPFVAPINLNGPPDMEKLEKLSGDVKVVTKINWCYREGLKPNMLGCAPIPGKFIVVVRRPEIQDQEGILWLHEYGHNKGLDHRNDTNAVMNETLALHRRYVDATECAMYQKQ